MSLFHFFVLCNHGMFLVYFYELNTNYNNVTVMYCGVHCVYDKHSNDCCTKKKTFSVNRSVVLTFLLML